MRPRLAGAIVAVLLVALGIAAAATAGRGDDGGRGGAKGRHCANGKPSKSWGDPRRDAEKGIDVRGLGAWNKNGDACYWTTIVGNFNLHRAQVIQVYYDTKGRHRGPEFQVFAYSDRDTDSRTGRFVVDRRGSPHLLRCTTFSYFSRHQIRLGVVKSCFGAPTHVRVKVQLFDIKKYLSGNRWRGQVDQVPNHGYTRSY